MGQTNKTNLMEIKVNLGATDLASKSSFELIGQIVVGSLHGDVQQRQQQLHGDVQQQPVLLPAAPARLHEAGRDGPAPARPGNPIGQLATCNLDKSLVRKTKTTSTRSTTPLREPAR